MIKNLCVALAVVLPGCLSLTLPAAATAQTGDLAPITLAGVEGCLPHDIRLARDPDGGFVAAWADGTVHVRRFDRLGAAVSQDRELQGPAELFSPPALAVSPSGTIAVTSKREGVWRLHALDRDLFPIGTPTVLAGVVAAGRPLVAADRDRGFVVVWPRAQNLAVARFDSLGAPLGPVVETGPPLLLQELLVGPSGDVWMTTPVGQLVTSPPSGAYSIYRLPAGSTTVQTVRDGGGSSLYTLGLASGAGSEVVLALGRTADITIERLDASGASLGPPTVVVSRDNTQIQQLELSSDGAGNLLLVWSEGLGSPDEPTRIETQALTPGGEPAGPVAQAGTETVTLPLSLDAAALDAGDAMVAWAEVEVLTVQPIPCEDLPGPHAARLSLGGPDELLLGNGRFRVAVEWQTGPSGPSNPGHSIPDSDDSGSFWFFDPANVELVTKVIDGSEVNGHLWLFYGALSNVGYRITVTDQLGHTTQTYDNPQGHFGSFADTAAFPGVLP